jgi:hypothetical protein
MTVARTHGRTAILLAGLLTAVFWFAGRAEAQMTPVPDIVVRQGPLPLPVVIFLAEQRARTPAPAPQPIVCPRHTKPRVDCTPVAQH